MILELDTSSPVPIYMQLRNQIVIGIGRGELAGGESLPTVRQMAMDTGINPMTVNKAYHILREEGFIQIDRRQGAKIAQAAAFKNSFAEKVEGELSLAAAKSKAYGASRGEFLELCGRLFDGLVPRKEAEQ